jgi:hypothetical protein
VNLTDTAIRSTLNEKNDFNRNGLNIDYTAEELSAVKEEIGLHISPGSHKEPGIAGRTPDASRQIS